MKTAYIAIHFTVTHSLYCIVYRFNIYIYERTKAQCVCVCARSKYATKSKLFNKKMTCETRTGNGPRIQLNRSIWKICKNAIAGNVCLSVRAHDSFLGDFHWIFSHFLTTQLINICRFFNDLISPTFFSLSRYFDDCVLWLTNFKN